MASFKEIVTKAVIGKGKKKFITQNSVTPEIMPTTILGCWVINHNFKGYSSDNKVVIEGNYDVNIWYSCLNDTKTEVIRHSDSYKEIVSVPRREDSDLTGNEEIIIRSLNQPSCVKTNIENGSIAYTIEKEMGVEIVGDTKVKISIDEDEDPWDDIEDEPDIEDIEEQIDNEVKEEFFE